MSHLWLDAEGKQEIYNTYEGCMSFREIPTTERAEWLQWRHRGIGSSDASIIMGVSRFKDIHTLLKEKSLPAAVEDDSNKYVKDRGNKIEMLVRTFLEQEMGHTFTAMSCESLTTPFLKATLDGISPCKKVITEIKLLSSVNPFKPNYKTEGYLKWLNVKEGVVPKDYYPQVQHQLHVTKSDMCVFAGYVDIKGVDVASTDNVALHIVYPDKEYIKNMLEKQFKFWYDLEVKRMESV